MKQSLRIALLILPAVCLALHAIDSADIWFHLATGDRILSHGLPQIDPFGAARPPVPWLVHDWLGGVVFAVVHRIGGAPALVLLSVLVFAVALVLPLVLAQRAGRATWPYEIAMLFGTLIAAERFFVRPEMFTILFATIWVQALAAGAPRTRRELWLLGLLQAVWTNLHAAFLLGPLLATLAIVGDGLDRALGRVPRQPLPRLRLALPLVCILASCLTPYGPRLLVHVVGAWRDVGARELRAGIVEWQATFAQPVAGDFVLMLFVASLVAVAVAFLAGRRRLRGFEVLASAALIALACTSRRHLPLYAVTVLPLAAACIARRPQTAARPAPQRSRMAAAVAAALPLVVATLLAADAVRGSYWARFGPPRTFGLGISAADHPIGAGDFVAQHRLPGPLFNNIAAGSYLIWRVHGDPPVLVDGRLLDPAMFRIYRRCLQSRPEFDAFTVQNGTRLVVLALQPFAPVGVFRHLAELPQWKLVYLDAEGAVFVHESVLASHPELMPLSLATPLPENTAPLGHAAGLLQRCDAGEAGRRGLVLGALGFPAAASADLTRAMLHCPGNDVFAVTLGKAQAALRRYAAAVPLLERAVQRDPYDLDAWLLLGICQGGLGRDAAAKAAWERAAALAPGDPRAARLLQQLEEVSQPEK
jgi:hypothetical protein